MTGEIIVAGNENNGELPALFAPDQRTAEKVMEFFTVNIRNANTRRAYAKAAGYFARWCINEVPIMSHPGQPAFMIGVMTRFRLMKWKEL